MTAKIIQLGPKIPGTINRRSCPRVGEPPPPPPEIPACVDQIIREVGARPLPDGGLQGLRDGIRVVVEHFVWQIIEECRINVNEFRRDVLSRIAAGPVEAAKVFMEERQDRLPHYQAAVVRALPDEIDIDFPETGQLPPEEAAMANVLAFERIAQAALALLATIPHSPRGRPSDNGDALDQFIITLVLSACDHKPADQIKIEALTVAICRALLAATRHARDELERRPDLQELPSFVHERVRRQLDKYERLGHTYERPGHTAIYKRVAKMVAAIRKREGGQANSVDAIRA